MSVGRTWTLLGAALLYTAAVSFYVGMSSEQTLGQGKLEGIGLTLGAFSFLQMVGYAVGFMILVALLDFVTQRKQEAAMALSIGLAAFATDQAITQMTFAQSYTHIKALSGAQSEQSPPNAPDTSR